LDNSVVAPLQDLVITAKAEDSDGIISKTEIYLQDVKLAELTSPPYTVSVPALRPGSYVITVRSTDNLFGSSTAQAKISTSEVSTNKFYNPEFRTDGFHYFFTAHYFDDFLIEVTEPGGTWNEFTRLTRTNFSAAFIDHTKSPARFFRAVQLQH
jgi:hypothetical protein